MPHSSITVNLLKPALREQARILRTQTDAETISARIIAQLRDLPELAAARDILLYLAMPGEINVEPLAADITKRWYAPRCLPKRQLGIYRYSAGETPLTTSGKQMRQPDPALCEPHNPDVLNAVIVPGLLFTPDGDRLGQGGGYYDRFLPMLPTDCVRIGVAPEACIVPTLPRDNWDATVDIVVSEARIFRANRRENEAISTDNVSSG